MLKTFQSFIDQAFGTLSQCMPKSQLHPKTFGCAICVNWKTTKKNNNNKKSKTNQKMKEMCFRSFDLCNEIEITLCRIKEIEYKRIGTLHDTAKQLVKNYINWHDSEKGMKLLLSHPIPLHQALKLNQWSDQQLIYLSNKGMETSSAITTTK